MHSPGGRPRSTFLCRAGSAFVLTAIAHLLGLRCARAETPRVRTPLLVFLPRPVPALAFTVVRGASALATWKAVDTTMMGRLGRVLDSTHPQIEGDPRSPEARDGTPHDPQRDRDATSLGVASSSFHGTGAALGGVGLGFGGVQLFDLAKGAGRLPVRVGPMTCQGGAGLTLGMRW